MVTLPSASVVSCRILWSLLPGPTSTRMFLLTSTGLEPPLAIPSTVTVTSAQTGDEAAARTIAKASDRKAIVNWLSRFMVATISRSRPPQGGISPYEFALQLLNSRKIEEALPILELLKSNSPDDSDILYDLGLAYSELGRMSEAIKRRGIFLCVKAGRLGTQRARTLLGSCSAAARALRRRKTRRLR
jgi:tetratricopeptide (TPR) repeat protein